jgi:phosphopantothenoylcysteine decarboxylase/phosphopantothenate--cysteine ligase
MNDRMWANVQTQRNVEHLRELGYDVLDPDTGALAVGEGVGPGRMPEPDTILAEIARRLGRGGSLEGKKIVVTAGATREAIDPVRFISNHSSGRMGVAIAASARRRGAHVTLIAGHLEVPSPSGVERVEASSVRDMRDAVRDALRDADVLIMAAAPADFRPVKAADQKIKKTSSLPVIELDRAEDILASTLDARRSDALIIGFALETQDLLDNAAKKLADKKLDLIVANDATEEGAGFGVDTNRVTLLSKDGSREDLPLMSKNDLADALLDRIEVMLNGRAR